VLRVSLRFLRRRRPESDPAEVEDLMVRQYRFLLRTAPSDVLEDAHAEALPRLDPFIRAAILRVVRETALGGQAKGAQHQVTLENTGKMAHLLTLAERRAPGSLLSAYDDASRQRLSQAVVTSQAATGALAGYDDWDGVDPDAERVVMPR
jgi:hypothetical protein